MNYIKAVLKETDVESGHFEFNFVSKRTIKELNKLYLNKTYITDIITFNLGDSDTIIADIYICPEKALENATDLNHSSTDEIKTLIIHGVLHLLGYNDQTEHEKKIMFNEQNRILDKLSYET